MKVPEYLSTGRAVVSVPSGRVAELVKDGEEGFLFVNTLANWQRFLENLPPRECLLEMGVAASRVPLQDWRGTARSYLDLIERQVEASRRGVRT
jgi:glycosyltransferase involved in cell wall biosynthesis